VNRDLTLRGCRRVKPSGVSKGEKAKRVNRTHSKAGEDRYEAQGGERSSSSGCTIAKSGEVVAGPGL